MLWNFPIRIIMGLSKHSNFSGSKSMKDAGIGLINPRHFLLNLKNPPANQFSWLSLSLSLSLYLL